MPVKKLSIRIEKKILFLLDRFIRKHGMANRSQVIQDAVREILERLSNRGRKVSRLVQECAKLDQTFERAMADNDLTAQD
ncbi:MAG: ribbon-helix-helix protein, CopG family [Candidatus Riflebacteria bacterium]|nr:ribbon-helix-helix protein, CopG family [Candidatus Riflebacteria bacterium]